MHSNKAKDYLSDLTHYVRLLHLFINMDKSIKYCFHPTLFRNLHLYLMNLLDLNGNRNLCLSLTIPKSYLQKNISNLYLTGLIFRFRKDAIDASDINRALYLEVLKMNGIENKEHPVTKNYLPFLLQLQQENRSDNSFPNDLLNEQLIQLAQNWNLESYIQKSLEK